MDTTLLLVLLMACSGVFMCILLFFASKTVGPAIGNIGGIIGGSQPLEPGAINVSVKAGTGAGRKHAIDKDWKVNLPDGAIASFDIKFNPGFEWGCRGKIGGLFIGTGSASGKEYSTTGASNRLMWGKNGSAYAYVYVPKGSQSQQPAPLNEKNDAGIGVWEDSYQGALKTGVWHHVELGVKLNSVTNGRPNADGVLSFSVDGNKRTLNGVIWRLDEGLDVRKFNLGVFHGGPCSAQQDSSLAFKNLNVRSWS